MKQRVVDIQTAALGFAGIWNRQRSSYRKLWNGTSWTEVGDLNTARRSLAGTGTSTLALACGGNEAPGTSGKSEEYNGTSWTEVARFKYSKNEVEHHAGIQTDAVVAFGGNCKC